MWHKHRRDHIHTPLLFVLSFIFFIALTRLSLTFFILHNTHTIRQTPQDYTQGVTTFDTSYFDNIQITGKAYIVYDLKNNQIISGKNIDTPLPLASITKVMTTISALKHNNSRTPITIDSQLADGSLDLGLKNKQEWDLKELLKYTLVFSSNDGAIMIANELGGMQAFTRQMTEDATALGFPLTFTNSAGLDEHGSLGGVGTIISVAKMIGFAQEKYPDIFDSTTKKYGTFEASNGLIKGIPNTNQTIEGIPGAIASKTGYTDSAGGNLAIVVDITLGHPVAIVVLGSTREDRFKDVHTLYTTLLKSIIPSRK